MYRTLIMCQNTAMVKEQNKMMLILEPFQYIALTRNFCPLGMLRSEKVVG